MLLKQYPLIVLIKPFFITFSTSPENVTHSFITNKCFYFHFVCFLVHLYVEVYCHKKPTLYTIYLYYHTHLCLYFFFGTFPMTQTRNTLKMRSLQYQIEWAIYFFKLPNPILWIFPKFRKLCALKCVFVLLKLSFFFVNFT